MKARHFKFLQSGFHCRRSRGEKPPVNLSINAVEVAADLDRVGIPVCVTHKPTVRWEKAGMRYRELKETTGSEHAMNFSQSTYMWDRPPGLSSWEGSPPTGREACPTVWAA